MSLPGYNLCLGHQSFAYMANQTHISTVQDISQSLWSQSDGMLSYATIKELLKCYSYTRTNQLNKHSICGIVQS